MWKFEGLTNVGLEFEYLALKADLYQLFGALSGKNIAQAFVSVE